MNADRIEISVITDISANIFAIFMLILIVLLAASESAPPPSTHIAAAPMLTIDIESELSSTVRTPLSASDIVDLLYDRHQSGGAIKIDVFDDRVDVVLNGTTERLNLNGPIIRQLRQATSSLPIELYVFDHHYYRMVTEGLTAAGQSWQELSIPQDLGLSQRDAATGQQHWSTAFAQLLARPLDRSAFRFELARLLASRHPSAEEPSGSGGNGRSDVSFARRTPEPAPLIARIRNWWRRIFGASAILGGLALILFVETKSSKIIMGSPPRISPSL